jgi:hypothetical protein
LCASFVPFARQLVDRPAEIAVGNSLLEMSMRSTLDPSQLTPEERRDAVAEILAVGFLRLRDRAALEANPTPENSVEASPEPLEVTRETSVTVSAG